MKFTERVSKKEEEGGQLERKFIRTSERKCVCVCVGVCVCE